MRLSNATLEAVAAPVRRPGYDRRAITAGVLHFGPGAFHRAHQAAAFDTVLKADRRWGVTGVSLNSAGAADALNPQDGLYTLALLDAETEYRVIGSIGAILTRHDTQAIASALASPDTRIVSATITEKGYCLAADGSLDLGNPAIRADLERIAGDAGAVPASFVGWLVSGLAARRAAGLPGLTILSCDNLADNGRKLGAAVRAFADEVDPDTARWIADACTFPNAMVDSITPATDDALRTRVAAAIGMEDAWPIQRERFTQWVIEDRFAGDRPELEAAGVTFAADVHPFEAAKLRLLNGAHSALAYIGIGRGLETVGDAMRDVELATFIERLMREDIVPTLTPPRGLDLSVYVSDVLDRFRNPAIRHLLAQIAWDGSQKLPYRLLDTIRDARAVGRDIGRLALPVAAWLRFLAHAAAEGRDVTDPLARPLLQRAPDWRTIVAMREVFGELADDPCFVGAVAAGMETLAGGRLAAEAA